MSYTLRLRAVAFAVIAAGAAHTARAQSFVLDLPLRSQQAEVSQRVGLTDIRITYHRPLVNGRQVWDSLVPYGKVWRVGANINATISFTDPVTIDGKPLAAGTYGLHMIPTADTWTIIFSKNSTSWGSFTYTPTEDALRVTVKPTQAAMHNALTFEFDQLQPTSTLVEMEWEKLAVPFTVAVDVHDVVVASLQRQLRSLARLTWMSWDGAANYLLAEHLDLDTALAYTAKSIDIEDRYDNEMTRAQVFTALNRPADAAAAQQKALALGSATQVDGFARQLMTEKRSGDAFVLFRENAKKYPDQWVVHEGLARMYSAQGKFADAEKEVALALMNAPATQQHDLDILKQKLTAKQDIN